MKKRDTGNTDIGEETKEKRQVPRIKLSTEGIRVVGSTIFGTIREIITHKKQITEKNAIMKEFYEYYESSAKKHSIYTKGEKCSFIALSVTMAHILALTLRYYFALTYLNQRIISNNAFYLLIATAVPFVSWLYATDENFWAFHKRKRMYFYICSINMLLVLIQPIYSLCHKLAARICILIPITPLTGVGMAVTLAQMIIIILMGVILFILYRQTEPLITSQSLRRQIEIFKFKHIVDERTDTESKYDLHVVKELETGKAVTQKENDRFVQTAVVGASGTGKTTSIFTTSIEEDLNTKIYNREKRQEEMLQLIVSGKATIQGPLREFKESAVIAIGKTKAILEKNEKELEKIRKRYPDAGITVIAPNASLNEDIIKLALARRVTVNAVDPVNNYSHYPNVRTVRMNPFYIPFDLSENERLIRIIQASSMFAEVLIATNQMSGETDPYFKDIALTVCSNIATIIMLHKNIKREQAHIEDIQEAINDFSKLKEYVEHIENHYEISITAGERVMKSLTAEDINKTLKAIEDKRRKDRSGAKKNPYYLQILFVKQELLGAGAEDMFPQSRGLRNLINKVLADPRITAMLSAKEEDTMLDFDEILSDNQITIVNTAIELGASMSTAFGLFFILSHKISVLRRPMNTRTPHFLMIDEATQYMHPCYEDMIALYRQFRCAVTISLQSLNQTEKSRATAYLKEVFLGAGTHIVFGRLTPEEMEIYSKMGGITREVEEQTTHTTNSILTSAPSSSESVRKTNVMTNVLEGSDMRLRDFQELTIFTIDNGRVLPGIIGRVFFVKPEAFDEKVTRSIKWKKLVPEAFYQDMGQKPFKESEETDESTHNLTLTDKVPDQEAELIVSQRQVDMAIEDKNEYEEMSLGELLGLLSGESTPSMSTEQNDKSKPKDKNNAEQKPNPPKETLEKDKYKQMLREFDRK